MGTECIDLYLFLPVFNRGRLTANFLAHILPLIPSGYSLKPVLLDDRSTDNTIIDALFVCPDALVIQLSGRDYWGGALNRIREFICAINGKNNYNHLYMVCNDDIRFSIDSLAEPLRIVDPSIIVSANTIHIEDDLGSLAACYSFSASIDMYEPMNYFDPSTGRFLTTHDPALVNLCETHVLISTAHPWLCSSPVPNSIPHYLSDFWLTYSFFNNGFRIIYPQSFACFNSLATTKNHPCSFGVNNDLTLKIYKIKIYAFKLFGIFLSAAQVTSPSYAPAWITFLSSFSRQKNIGLILLKHRLLYLLGRVSCVFVKILSV